MKHFYPSISRLGFNLVAIATLHTPMFAFAHGAMQFPQARQYYCRFSEKPEAPVSRICRDYKKNVYNWNAVRKNIQDEDNYQNNGINDKNICGLGFTALDEMPSDIKATSEDDEGNPITAGKDLTFVYDATVAHKTKAIDLYITNNGYDQNAPLTWKEMTKFCSIKGDYLTGSTPWKFTCHIPEDHEGHHVIASIWLTDTGTGDVFDGCSDVLISKNKTMMPVNINKSNVLGSLDKTNTNPLIKNNFTQITKLGDERQEQQLEQQRLEEQRREQQREQQRLEEQRREQQREQQRLEEQRREQQREQQRLEEQRREQQREQQRGVSK
ncbi:lytic polysaccharide monooxygenase [Shewanella sp. 202IG2-18]|uniref:lytic polysaccharide monooxygenase n=1 Tax=Parashewanella hymeniacidonis TaxID=2807618 RepID=UPI00195F9887|nr:lytic polysaccharide monooxygenase [Parashewanella hymeniacidonis]MBM7074477.1 lytic polysaccharide monooxygenase [Parashewanella hymeniacidonis]